MARAVVILCFMFATTEQVSFFHKVYPALKGNAVAGESTGKATFISEEKFLESFERSKPAFNLEESQKGSDMDRDGTSPFDGELYGMDSNDFDEPDFDIVLGQRVDFQEGGIGKREVPKSQNGKIGDSKIRRGRYGARVKRSLSDSANGNIQTPAGETTPVYTTPNSQLRNEQATVNVENTPGEEVNISESSGDGDVFDGPTAGFTNSNSSTDFTNEVVDGGNATSVAEDDEPFSSVSCDTNEDGQSCLQPSGEEFNAEEKENQGQNKAEQGDLSPLDGNDSRYPETGNIDTINGSDRKAGETAEMDTTSMMRPAGSTLSPSELTETTEADNITQETTVSEMFTESKETSHTTENISTTTNDLMYEESSSTLEESETISDTTENHVTSTVTSPEFTEKETTEAIVLPDETTDTKDMISLKSTEDPVDQWTTTDSPLTEESELTTETTESSSSEQTTTTTAAAIITVTPKLAETTPEIIKGTIETGDPAEETTTDSNDISTNTDASLTTEGPEEPTTVLTTVISETSSQTAVPVTTSPVTALGGPCGTTSELGDEGQCRDVSGAECIDKTCQCRSDRYQLGGTCEERDLGNSFKLKLEQLEATNSILVSWPELSQPPNFNVLKYRLRWKEEHENLMEVPRNPEMRRAAILPEADVQQTIDQNCDIESENVKCTNETTIVINKLTPGSLYLIEVAALVAMAEDGRLEELWYPPGAFTLKPSCLTMEDTTLVASNRTMIVTFEPLLGTYYKCFINVKASGKESESISGTDCQSYVLTPFEFGVEYKIETKVITGQSEKSCTDTLTVTRESKRPDKVCTLRITDVSSDFISIMWEPPCKQHGYLTGYELILKSEDVCKVYKFMDTTVTEGASNEENLHSHLGDLQRLEPNHFLQQRFAQHSTTICSAFTEEISRSIVGQQTFTFTGLNVEVEYQIKLSAFNEKGRGEEIEETVSTSALRPGPPTHFRGVAKGTSLVHLTWDPPQPYPGSTNYTISVYMVPNWYGAISTPRQVYTRSVKGYSSTEIEIPNLAVATYYRFEIVAKTMVGISETAAIDDLQTWEIESHPVTDLQMTHETFDTVTLSWKAPPQGNGRTRAYVVLVKTNDETCVQAKAITNLKTQTGPTQPEVPTLHKALSLSCNFEHLSEISSGEKQLRTTLTVTDLNPNTFYIFRVMAYNSAGLGEYKEIQWTTRNAVPNTPTKFKCSSTDQGRGELYLSWEPPVPEPGATSYSLEVLEADEDNGLEFHTIKEKELGGYNNDHKSIKNLRDFWLYKVSLKAATPAGDSAPVESNVCRTRPAVPGKVTKMSIQSVSSTGSQLHITWECPKPEDRHGILEYFTVYAMPDSKNRDDLNLDDLKTIISKVEVKKNLKGSPDCTAPFTTTIQAVCQVTYVVTVVAKVETVKRFGASLKRRIYTSASAPSALPKPERRPTKEAQSSEFKVTICPLCLMNADNGQILRYGLGVCKKGFCDVGSRANHTFGDYANLATWKASKAANFEIPYQIFDNPWKHLILSGVSGGHVGVEFIVGNQTTCIDAPDTEYCNGPLPPQSAFRVFQFSCTIEGCTESDLSEVAITAAAASLSDPTSDPIVLGGAASGVVLVLIVILIILFVRARFRKVIDITETGQVQDIQLTDIAAPKEAVHKRSRPIKIKDFEETLHELHANNNDLFSQEFTELDMDSIVHPTTVGSDPQYRKLNRWSNILPYDHTRVKLKIVDGDEKCADDYINANFLVGYHTAKDYIATQGPLTTTVPDFWRMVWEQEAAVIVMLSAFQEKDPRTGMLREKVAQYYPDETDSEGCRYDHVVVSWRGKLDNQAWEVRTFHLTHLLERRSRYVKHFFFKSWTDHKADISPQDLINFVTTVRDESENYPPGPIVVHCSAGVGRTGTFIAVDYFCRYIKDLTKGSSASKISDVMGSLRGSWAKRKSLLWEDNTVDIYGRIIALRDCRRYMVQTKAQYAFIYDTVMELIRRASRGDDTSESGADTESSLSESVPGAGTPASNDAVYDDVDTLTRTGKAR